MIRVSIHVSGPGGTLTEEVKMIQRSLELIGYNVDVKTDHPFAPLNPLGLHSGSGRMLATIWVQNQPWGG